MNTYIGIDLGTSSVKLLLVDECGKILNSVTHNYPVSYPRDNWSEQNPEDWDKGVTEGIKDLLTGQNASSVNGIGVGGQMHGLVLLDKFDAVIRPCILWNDGRTQAETDYLNNEVGKDRLSLFTANIAYAGFTAPKILWVKRNEPQSFKRIAKIMLPKDYIAYKLCGEFCTDFSDASGTLLLDVEHKRWSDTMCELCDVKSDWLPRLFESYEPIGTISKRVAHLLGLPSNVTVCTGAGDNAAAAVGTGTVNDGDCNISLGTSGTVFISRDFCSVPNGNALHSFAHANGKYHLMGCILSAASCNAWWMNNVLCTKEYAEQQRGLDSLCGKNDLFFLPYLMGERSPHNDTDARGAFIGLRPTTTRESMTLAVMEGVAFALRDCVEAAKACGAKITRTSLCGGGAKSRLWQSIITNVINVPVDIPSVQEGPAYGGALLSMVACGKFDSVKTAAATLTAKAFTVTPDKNIAELYDKRYGLFTKLYPALKDVYKEMNK